MTKSLELNPGALDHLAPFLGIRRDQCGERVGRAACRLFADGGEARLELSRLDRLIDRGIELVDDRFRHAGGRDDAGPGRRRIAEYVNRPVGILRRRRCGEGAQDEGDDEMKTWHAAVAEDE